MRIDAVGRMVHPMVLLAAVLAPLIVVGAAEPATQEECGTASRAGLRVRVVDAEGAALPAATVEARSDGRVVLRATTDDSGEATLLVPPSREYTVGASLPGFETAATEPVFVRRECLQILKVLLNAAGGCSMEVTAESPELRGLQGVVFDFDQPPRVVSQTEPRYPREALDAGIEGVVEVEVRLEADGQVSTSRITKSVPSLDAAALECVSGWRFEPAKKGGRPVPTLTLVPVRFRIARSSGPKE